MRTTTVKGSSDWWARAAAPRVPSSHGVGHVLRAASSTRRHHVQCAAPLRRVHPMLGVALLLLICTAAAAPQVQAKQLNPGQVAPEFSLPALDGTDVILSESFLRNQPFTALVFWNTECPECVNAVERCGSFEDSLRTLGVQLLGINDDTENINSVRDLLRAREIGFLQLSDSDRQVALSFGAEPFSFSLFILDSASVVYDVFYDRPADVKEVLFGMVDNARSRAGKLTAVARETLAPGTTVTAAPAAISFSGELRLRAMDLQVEVEPNRLDDPTGPYGEALEAGRYLTHRLQMTLGARLSERFSAGALIRISSEDEDVLELGPQYFANQLGSVYVKYAAGGFQARLGYFDAYFTPLSLMRWDAEDNPKSGGSTGSCACIGSAGALLTGSLEELGPTLTFEGLDVAWPLAPFADVRAFYAIPRTAHEVSYIDYYGGREGIEEFRYRRDLYGIRAGFNPSYFFRALSSSISLHSIVARDEEKSATLPVPGLEALVPAVNNQVYGGEITLPLHRNLTVQAEFDRSRLDSDVRKSPDPIVWGTGILASVKLGISEGVSASAAYLRTSEDFSSAYSALSYEPNREGARGSVSLGGDKFGVELFAKYLKPIQEDSQQVSGTWAHYVLQEELTGGLWVSGRLMAQFEAGCGWILRRENHDARSYGPLQPPQPEVHLGSGLELDDHVASLQLGRDLGPGNRAELLYQYVKHTDGVHSANDYSAHRTSLQLSVRF